MVTLVATNSGPVSTCPEKSERLPQVVSTWRRRYHVCRMRSVTFLTQPSLLCRLPSSFSTCIPCIPVGFLLVLTAFKRPFLSFLQLSGHFRFSFPSLFESSMFSYFERRARPALQLTTKYFCDFVYIFLSPWLFFTEKFVGPTVVWHQTKIFPFFFWRHIHISISDFLSHQQNFSLSYAFQSNQSHLWNLVQILPFYSPPSGTYFIASCRNLPDAVLTTPRTPSDRYVMAPSCALNLVVYFVILTPISHSGFRYQKTGFATLSIIRKKPQAVVPVPRRILLLPKCSTLLGNNVTACAQFALLRPSPVGFGLGQNASGPAPGTCQVPASLAHSGVTRQALKKKMWVKQIIVFCESEKQNFLLPSAAARIGLLLTVWFAFFLFLFVVNFHVFIIPFVRMLFVVFMSHKSCNCTPDGDKRGRRGGGESRDGNRPRWEVRPPGFWELHAVAVIVA